MGNGIAAREPSIRNSLLAIRPQAGGNMTTGKLQGVIAAIATAVDETGEPDCARSVALARFLLANGCDGLNVLGTTGEATSFSLDQRKRVMTAYRDAGLPLDRLMVGTGRRRSPTRSR